MKTRRLRTHLRSFRAERNAVEESRGVSLQVSPRNSSTLSPAPLWMTRVQIDSGLEDVFIHLMAKSSNGASA